MKLKIAGSFVRSFIALIALSSASAFAFPLATIPYLELDQNSPNFFAAENSGYNFDGIVALSNCSGSLVRFKTSLATDQAMVLTNGHCLANMFGGGMPKANVVVVDRAMKRQMWVLDHQTGKKAGTIHAEKIIYASMTKTDMTLYRLTETYAQIEQSFGTHAFTMADQSPAVGDAIDVVSGYWRRGYSCKVDGIVRELREADWTMVESIRYSQPGCEIIGGTSGSPILSVDTKEVVGVNNTMNESGKKCAMNNPCEVDATGAITFEKGKGYGQQTAWVYTCLGADRNLNLDLPGCLLAKPVPGAVYPTSTWPSVRVQHRE